MTDQPQPRPPERAGMDPDIGATLRHWLTQLVTLLVALATLVALRGSLAPGGPLVPLALAVAGGVTLWRLFRRYPRNETRRSPLFRVAVGLALGVTLGCVMALLIAWRGGGAGG
ncbi:MAG: hypothetical protein HY423_13580 [Candidatus Lambdaproteobacteria bacterium]|nr:hypothetical protein [Candidatus Lambdaproteobacteria bacterium]